MLQSQGLLHDTYVYGVDAKKIVLLILSPTEVMDEPSYPVIVYPRDKNPTYVHIRTTRLLKTCSNSTGKTLNFCMPHYHQ